MADGKTQRCPCGNALLECTDLEQQDATLVPGDYAICDACGRFHVMRTDLTIAPIADEVVRRDPRFTPASIDQLFEAQKAVRARARLLVTRNEQGERVIQMVEQVPGRKTVDRRKN